MQNLKKKIEAFEIFTDELTELIETKKVTLANKKKELADIEMFTEFDESLVSSFIKKPYTIIPRKDEEWYLVVPKLFDLHVGYLTKSDESYNVFIVNKYAKFLGGVPSEFEDIFKFKRKIPAKVIDGVVLTGEAHQEEVWKRYNKHLFQRKGKDQIKIKKGKEFDLIASLINDGILPFVATPVEKEHLVKTTWLKEIPEIEKRRNMSFFQDAKNKFMATGAIGVYWAMGTGKTLFGLELLASINVNGLPNLVISGNSVMLKEQWSQKLKLIKPASRVRIETYHSWHKVKDKEWGLVIFDECHHLPANTFSKLSTLKTEYRVGLSATPYREDGRTDYIFALTGFPVGLDWKVLIELGLLEAPDITLYLCSNARKKREKLAEILQDAKKTLIYSFSVKTGKSLSKELDIPFVFGQTPIRERREIIDNSLMTIISSAGREGLSIQDLKRTITYDFLFGSRQEETQFFGRVLHGEDKGEHIIMMTDEEFEKYGKRLYGIQEKGFKVRMVRL